VIEEEEDEQVLKPGKGLHRSLPVLLEDRDGLTISDIENMVNEVPWRSRKAKAAELRKLHEIQEIVQEFTNVRYPWFKEQDTVKGRTNILPDRKPPPGRKDVNKMLMAVMQDHVSKVESAGKLMEDDIPRL
jgi:hypothetical protein